MDNKKGIVEVEKYKSSSISLAIANPGFEPTMKCQQCRCDLSCIMLKNTGAGMSPGSSFPTFRGVGLLLERVEGLN